MSAQLEPHRAALVALLQSVPNIGLVHAFEPYAGAQAKLHQFYLYTPPGGTPALRGWYVRRTSTGERELHQGRVLDVHSWTLTGLLALADDGASELVMDGLVEAVRLAYRADPSLGGVNQLGLPDGYGVQVADSGPAVFAGVLVHRARLTLKTYAYLSHGE